MSVTVPARELSAHDVVPVAIDIENRGRVGSPASEVQLCSGDSGTPCQTKLELISLPPLASGERIHIVRHALTGDESDQSLVFSATIDPDNATGEANRGNNAAVSTPAKVTTPVLEVVTLQPDAAALSSDGTIGVSVAIRNPSFGLPSPRTVIRFSGGEGFNGWGNDTQYSLDFPPLAPRQALAFALRLRIPKWEGVTDVVLLKIDPDGKVWPNGGPLAKSASFKR